MTSPHDIIMALLPVAEVVAPVIAFVMFIPQAVITWQARHEPDRLSGISSGSQWLLLANACTWGILAYGLGSFAVGAPGLVNGPLAIMNLTLIHKGRCHAVEMRRRLRRHAGHL